MSTPPSPSDVTGNLKRSITLPQAMGISFHQVVGGGVVALMGTAIGLAGGGAPLAFLLAAIAVLVYSLPFAVMGSAMPVVGARYRYAASLLNRSAGFATMWLSIAIVVQLSLMALAAAKYLEAMFDGLPVRTTAVVIVTVFFLANLVGAAFSSRLGIALAVVMLAAFGMYIAVGMGQVNWGTFSDMAPSGITDFATAVALLTFSTTGATYVAELGGEMKHPSRDIPVSVIGGTVLAAGLYVVMAIVSVGVLAIPEVANKPMSVVAEHLLSPGGFAFFILGGAVTAVIGHINTLLLAATKPVLAAVSDGWFPTGFGAVNKRFGTPHWLLFALYLVGVVPLFFDLSLTSLAGIVSVMAGPMLAIIVISSLRLRRCFPELHAATRFRVSRPVHVASVVLGTAILGVQTYLVVERLTLTVTACLAAYLAAGAALWALRRKHVARLHRGDGHPAPPATGSPAVLTPQ